MYLHIKYAFMYAILIKCEFYNKYKLKHEKKNNIHTYIILKS